MPHMESQKAVPVLRQRGVRAIDLSADYRLRDPNDYVTWYRAPHVDAEGLAAAVYGLQPVIVTMPAREMGGEEPPASVAAAMREADAERW